MASPRAGGRGLHLSFPPVCNDFQLQDGGRAFQGPQCRRRAEARARDFSPGPSPRRRAASPGRTRRPAGGSDSPEGPPSPSGVLPRLLLGTQPLSQVPALGSMDDWFSMYGHPSSSMETQYMARESSPFRSHRGGHACRSPPKSRGLRRANATTLHEFGRNMGWRHDLGGSVACYEAKFQHSLRAGRAWR